MPEQEVMERVVARHLPRIPGAATFLSWADEGMPPPLINFARHLRVLHERVLIMTMQGKDQPRLSDDERVEVVPLAEGIDRVILRFGFMDSAHIPEALRHLMDHGGLKDVDPDKLTYFISHETVVQSDIHPAMPAWMEEIVALMPRMPKRPPTPSAFPPDRSWKSNPRSKSESPSGKFRFLIRSLPQCV